MSVFVLSPPLKCEGKDAKMQNDLSRGGDDCLDSLESQEDSSEEYV